MSNKDQSQIESFLQKKGIKASFHRLKILDYLWSNKDGVNKEHKTADQIFNALSSFIPTLSKTTVYNTLNLFVKKNVIRSLNIDENQVIYDPILEFHGHFFCENCNLIQNFTVSDNLAKWIPENEDLKIELINQRHFYLKGICKDCGKLLE